MADALLVQRGVEKENEIGTIIKSTKADMGDKYLLCNGDQILESDGYGDLIDYLGEDKYYSYNDSSSGINTYIVPDPAGKYMYKITDSSSGMTFTTYNSLSDLVNGATPKMNLEFANYRLANGDISDICCVYTLSRVYITIKDTANSKYNVLRVIRGNYSSSSNYTLYFSSGISTSSYRSIKMVANDNYVLVVYDMTDYISVEIIKINYVDNGDGTHTSNTESKSTGTGSNKFFRSNTSWILTGCFIVENYLVIQMNYSTNNKNTIFGYIDISASLSDISFEKKIITYTFVDGIYDSVKVHNGYMYLRIDPYISNYSGYYLLRAKTSDIFSSSTSEFASASLSSFVDYQIYNNKELSDSTVIITTTNGYDYTNTNGGIYSTTSSIFDTYPIPDSHLKNTKYVCIGNKIYFANNSDRCATLPNISSDDGVYTYIKAK